MSFAQGMFVWTACSRINSKILFKRSRLQAQGTSGHPRTYKSPWEAVQVTFQQEGPRGFYKGLGPTLLKVHTHYKKTGQRVVNMFCIQQVVPAVSLSYVTYEWSKRELGLS